MLIKKTKKCGLSPHWISFMAAHAYVLESKHNARLHKRQTITIMQQKCTHFFDWLLIIQNIFKINLHINYALPALLYYYYKPLGLCGNHHYRFIAYIHTVHTVYIYKYVRTYIPIHNGTCKQLCNTVCMCTKILISAFVYAKV